MTGRTVAFPFHTAQGYGVTDGSNELLKKLNHLEQANGGKRRRRTLCTAYLTRAEIASVIRSKAPNMACVLPHLNGEVVVEYHGCSSATKGYVPGKSDVGLPPVDWFTQNRSLAHVP